MSKESVVKILMRRDNMSHEDAKALVDLTVEEIENCDDYGEAEDIMANNLGLEMDYLIDLI